MSSIVFNEGVKEFDVNGKATISFSPTDMDFIERVYNALDSMDKKQEKYGAEIEAAKDKEIFEIARRMDGEAREEINGLFGCDVCSPVFDRRNLYSLADGFPVWANFLLAIIEQLEGAFAEEKKKTNPRIKKYTEKYAKK